MNTGPGATDNKPSSRRPTAIQSTAVSSHLDWDWSKKVDPAVFASLPVHRQQRLALFYGCYNEEKRFQTDLRRLSKTDLRRLSKELKSRLQKTSLPAAEDAVFCDFPNIQEASLVRLNRFERRIERDGPLVLSMGEIFTEFSLHFPNRHYRYIDDLPGADEMIVDLLKRDKQLGEWSDTASGRKDPPLDLRALVHRPWLHLQFYQETMGRLLEVIPRTSPDYDHVLKANSRMEAFLVTSKLKLFHNSNGRGPFFKKDKSKGGGTFHWDDFVSTEDKNKMDPKEIYRQQLIFELITGEMEYVRDLKALYNVFIKPLPDIYGSFNSSDDLDTFVDVAFHNYHTIYSIHASLLGELKSRQRKEHPQFGVVSDLFLASIETRDWLGEYTKYMANLPFSTARLDEMANNPAFAAFLERCYKDPQTDRHQISHFTHRPHIRLSRYRLPLKPILESLTAVGLPGHPDFEGIPKLMNTIHMIVKTVEVAMAGAKAQVELQKLAATLDSGAVGKSVLGDVDLSSKQRVVIREGPISKGIVYRKIGTMGQSEPLLLLLLDNYLIRLREQRSATPDGPVSYSIESVPLPIQLLKLEDFSQSAQAPSRSLSLRLRRLSNKELSSDSNMRFPFTYSSIGEPSKPHTLWTNSKDTRDAWKTQFKQAIALGQLVAKEKEVFKLQALITEKSAIPLYGGFSNLTGSFARRVTCSFPFNSPDGRSLIAVGCENGVWVGLRGVPNSFKKLNCDPSIRNVTQIAALEEFNVFLVLAEKRLYAYHITTLFPTAQPPPPQTQLKLWPDKFVPNLAFFAIGKHEGKTLIILVGNRGASRRPRLNSTASHQGEWVYGGLQLIPPYERAHDTEWYRSLNRYFSSQTQGHGINFLANTLADSLHWEPSHFMVVCNRGFESMNMKLNTSEKVPDFAVLLQDPSVHRHLAKLKRLNEQIRPLGIFTATQTEFLVCYATFGMYMDLLDRPNRDYRPIEWHTTHDSVAFHPPYILLVSPTVIEVRHVSTGRLVQLYLGKNMKATWNGNGAEQQVLGEEGWGEVISSRRASLHVSMDKVDHTGDDAQHLFEVVPR